MSVRSNVVTVHHLVGVAEVADMLGVSRRRVNQLTVEDDTFPSPEAVLSAGKVWTRAAILEWAKATGRL